MAARRMYRAIYDLRLQEIEHLPEPAARLLFLASDFDDAVVQAKAQVPTDMVLRDVKLVYVLNPQQNPDLTRLTVV